MSRDLMKAQVELIDAAYATATDAGRWGDMVACAQSWFGGLGAVYARSADRPDANRLLATSYDGAFKASYNARYAGINPLIANPRKVSRPLLHSEEVIAYDDLTRTEFYADWMAPQDMDYGISLEISGGGDSTLNFAILRSRTLGRFSDDEQRLCESLMPHLRRALEISDRLGLLETSLTACLGGFETLAAGVLLVDDRGRLQFANGEGERLLRAGDGLFLSGDRPTGRASRAESALRAAVHGATRRDGGPRTAATFGVSRNESHAPLSVTVTPARGEGGLALVLLHDPDRRPRPDPEALRRIYGLTPAEARLAAALCDGLTLADHARVEGVSETTLKTHLKAVFGKLDVNRQTDLVGRLTRDPSVRFALD